MTRWPGWQIAVVLPISLLVGRWLTGPGFGFGLFVLVWLPIAVNCLPTSGLTRQCATLVFLNCGVAGGILAFDASFTDTLRCTLLLTVWSLMLLAVREALCFAFRTVALIWRKFVVPRALAQRPHDADQSANRQTAIALTVISWLTWLTIPVTRADGLNTMFNETVSAVIWTQHPVLSLNSAFSSGPDWTHAALAYRYLTVLGQDVPYEWPATWGLCLTLPLCLFGLSALLIALLRLFHVEQASSVI